MDSLMQLGRYTLLRRVGSGGMAEVWKARVKGPAGFQKTLAIKRILPDRLTEPEYVELFIAEAKLVAQLQHPNIVQVFDFGVVPPEKAWEKNEEYYMAMEYVAGQNVREVTKRMKKLDRRWPLELALFVVMETAKALTYAHKGPAGMGHDSVIHRDISPHNILVSFLGRVKVADFGIARVTNVLPRTADGIRRGKISYMSPEQIDLRPLDGRSDIFSLGAVLYELLTREKLFTGAEKAEIAYKIRTLDVSTLPGIENIAGDVRFVIERALQVDPEKRYQDAKEVVRDLRSILGVSGEQEAPEALASLLRELFEEEFRRESLPDDFDAAGATRVTPLMSLDDDSQSAATLLSSAAQVIVEPDDLASPQESAKWARPRGPEQGSGVFGTAANSRRANWAQISGLAFAAVVLVALGVLLARFVPAPTETATVTAAVRVTATARKTPRSTPRVARATPRQRATARQRATPRATQRATVAPVEFCTVSVMAKPWAQIYVDGVRIAKATPVRRYKLSAGSHVIEARHPALGTLKKRVFIPKDEHIRLFADFNAKTFRKR